LCPTVDVATHGEKYGDVARRKFPWVRVTALALLLGAEVILLVVGGAMALQQGLSIVGGGGVTIACAVWVVRGIHEWRHGTEASDDRRLELAASDLSEAVRRTWSREAVHRGLTSPLPIAVGIRAADPRISAHPAQWATPRQPVSETGTVALTGTAADLATLYSRVASGRLVIIGAPGGGKTGAAVLLLLSMFDPPRADHRVPVWFPLGSWDASTTTVAQWMADQLVSTYGTPPAAAEALVISGRILPVLDGLDEIAEDSRNAAMAGLDDLGTTPLVLTCRTEEYRAAIADGILAAAAVVEVAPVDPVTAAAYLSESGTSDARRWDAVRAAVNAPEPNACQEALRSPLMLSLARFVYRAPASDPAELTTYPTADDVEDRLLDGLIPALYGRDATDTTAADAHRWLSFFAEQLPVLGPGAIAWWRLPRCVPRRRLRTVAGLAWALPASLLTLVLLLSFFPLSTWPWFDKAIVILAPVVVTGLVGVTTGAVATTPLRWSRPTVHAIGRGFRHGLKRGLATGIGACLVFGLTVGLLDARRDGIVAGFSEAAGVALVSGSIIGVIAGVALGLAEAFSGQQRDAVTPLSSFRTDVKAVVTVALLTGVITGPAAGFLIGALIQLEDVLAYREVPGPGALGAHLIAVLNYSPLLGVFGTLITIFWLGLRGCSAWWYCVAASFLARRRLTPRRPLQFLEEAYRRGVLRQAGMVYEFRHARLAERLRGSG
jgi:hypothetical protein